MDARKGMGAIELLLVIAALGLVAWTAYEGYLTFRVIAAEPDVSAGPATAHDAQTAVEDAGYLNAQFTQFWRTVDITTLGCESRDKRAFSVQADDESGAKHRFLVCCRGRDRNKVCAPHER